MVMNRRWTRIMKINRWRTRTMMMRMRMLLRMKVLTMMMMVMKYCFKSNIGATVAC